MDFRTKRLVSTTIWWMVVILFFIVVGVRNEQLKRDEKNAEDTKVELNICVVCETGRKNKEE